MIKLLSYSIQTLNFCFINFNGLYFKPAYILPEESKVKPSKRDKSFCKEKEMLKKLRALEG